MALVSQIADNTLWHAQLGHLSYSTLYLAHKDGMVDGLPAIGASTLVRQSCLCDKRMRLSFPQEATHRASKPFELVHSDLCGPMSTEFLSGASYMMLIIDNFSRYIWASFMKTKDLAFTSFKDWRVKVKNPFEHKVKALHTDRGGEFLSKEFDRYLADHDIWHQLSTAHTLSQNGVAKHKNHSVMEMGCMMLENSDLPRQFWAEASALVVHIILNRAVTSALPSLTPFEALTGTKPSCAHLRVFHCQAYVHVPKEQRSKLDCKSIQHVFLGYSSVSKAYQLWDPAGGKLIIFGDMIFDEPSTSSSNAALLPLPLAPPTIVPSPSPS